jgi:hypothetical protein
MNPISYFLTAQTPSVSARLVNTLMRPEAICIQVGTHLCPHSASGLAEPIQVSRLFIQKNPHQFIRPTSQLHIIAIAPVDEAHGSSNPTILRRPSALTSEFSAKFPGNELRFHSFIRRPGARCNSHSEFRSADLLAQLSAGTGGSVLDMCDDFEMASLKALAQSFRSSKTLQKQIRLQCEPIDQDGDGIADLQIRQVSNQQEVAFSRDKTTVELLSHLSPREKLSIRYFCQ